MATKTNFHSKFFVEHVFKMNSIKGKSKHHANYILREKYFKFNAPCCEFRIDNIMNGDNEGFLCEVKFPFKCKATDLDFFCLYT